MGHPPTGHPLIGELRSRIAAMERGIAARRTRGVLRFGVPEIDAALPGDSPGLPLGALHEVAGSGPDSEHGAAAALWIAGVLGRLPGQVLWVLERRDLFAPALAAVGLNPDRVIFAEARNAVLLVMEEGLSHRGLAGVVGEVGKLSLTGSRRLQLAAEASGVVVFALRRSRKHDDPAFSAPTAAMTRWRLAALPSPPPLAHAPDTPGLARSRWRLDLTRCRGGEAASWTVEACDAKGRLRLAPDLAHRPAAPARHRLAG
jgi:protein ImuA